MKKCPKCNKIYDDSWSVCLYCNNALIQDNKDQNNPSAIEKEGGQFSGESCVICRIEKMHPKDTSSFLGLFPRNSMVCDKCGVVFIQDGTKWKLAEINDENNSIWQKYEQQTLSAREWINIGNGGLSDKEQQDTEAKFWMDKISSGGLKVKVIRAEAPIILQKNEETLCVLPNIFLCEFRAIRVNRGGYGGASFRVAKGVSIRLGQYGGRGESHPEPRQIDQGTLVVTNKRFIYCGAIKTVDIALRKIVQVDP